MKRIPILVLLCFLSAQGISAQQGFIWTDSIVEYSFSNSSDSLRQHKVVNYVLEEDSATHLQITASWYMELGIWVNKYRSIGIFDENANKLEFQNFSWGENGVWTGLNRSFFWYDSIGGIKQFRRDIWDQGETDSGWTRQDSTVDRWETDSLVQVSEKFSWFRDSLSWGLSRSWKTEKIRDSTGIISEEIVSRLDTSTMEWTLYSKWVNTYDSLGNLTQMSNMFLSGLAGNWFEYIRRVFYYDETLNMNMEEKHIWDFKKSDWDLVYRGGVAHGDSHIKSQIFGLWDPKFNKWSYYREVVSEFDARGLIENSTFYSGEPEGELGEVSQSRYAFNEKKQPILQASYNWNSNLGDFEIESKKYFYYPVPVGVDNDATSQKSYIAYPNPVSNTLHIEGPDRFAQAEIFDLNGQLLISSGDTEIDMSGLSPGLYLLKISENGGTSELLVIIKI